MQTGSQGSVCYFFLYLYHHGYNLLYIFIYNIHYHLIILRLEKFSTKFCFSYILLPHMVSKSIFTASSSNSIPTPTIYIQLLFNLVGIILLPGGHSQILFTANQLWDLIYGTTLHLPPTIVINLYDERIEKSISNLAYECMVSS